MTVQRRITLNSVLGPDQLLVRSATVSEHLGSLTTMDLQLLSPNEAISMDDVLGSQISLELALSADTPRFFHGLVSEFTQTGRLGRYATYSARVVPWLWLLTRTSDCRIFQQMSIPDIIKAVFREQGTGDFEDTLSGSYLPREYCVQYMETDFNFVSRLMEEEGIYYFLRHDTDKDTVVLCDNIGAHSAFPEYGNVPYFSKSDNVVRDEDHIDGWLLSHSIQSGRLAHTHFDFAKPRSSLLAQSVVSANYPKSDQEIFEYPGRYLSISEGKRLAQRHLESIQQQRERVQGSGNVRGLAVGSLFTLEGHPRDDQNREYLVVSTVHQFVGSEYESGVSHAGGDSQVMFDAIPSQQQYRSPKTTPKSHVAGPQTAIVVGPPGEEIHTDKYGRVKVQFHWDRYGKRDENSSCFIRASQPWAGKRWGSVSTPRIGQEVIVDFLEGDPDQPIITGRVYNEDNQPPFGFPAGAVVSGLMTNTHKGVGSNQMSMDDTAGKEKITIHGQYDMNTTVEHDQTNTVNNTFTEVIKSDASIQITEGKFSHDVKTGTSTSHVTGAVTERFDSTQTTTVKSDIKIVSTGGAVAITSDTQHIYVHAATSIQLRVGPSMIWMDNTGQISIEGVNVSVKGSDSVTISGGVVHSEAQAEHQTKGAIVSSEGSATNTIKGGMVMLNP